jgi:hypothetical protein
MKDCSIVLSLWQDASSKREREISMWQHDSTAVLQFPYANKKQVPQPFAYVICYIYVAQWRMPSSNKQKPTNHRDTTARED